MKQKTILERILAYNNISEDDLLNPKLKAMATHPFLFLRATAEEFYKIMSEEPFISREIFDNELKVWSPGDQHIGNFEFAGVGGNGEEIDFRLQDFDETFETNPFYDILRLTSSLHYYIEEFNVTIGREFPDMFMALEPHVFTDIFLDSYHETINKENRDIEWERFPFLESIKRGLQETERNVKSCKFIKEGKFKKNSDKLERIDNSMLLENISESIKKTYPEHKLLDVSRRKVAGVGSSNLNRFYFILQDNQGTEHLMELKEQIKPAQIHYLKKEKEKYEKKYSDKTNAEIHIKGINKMIGKERFDERIESISFKVDGVPTNFISRTIPNKKTKLKEEHILEGVTNDSSNIGLISNRLEEYITLAGNRLAAAHRNTVSEKKKGYFLETMNYYLTTYRPRLKGIAKHTHNSIAMQFSQYVREYFAAIGNRYKGKELEQVMENMTEISEAGNSGDVKKAHQNYINNKR